MQTGDTIDGLQHFREFSKYPQVFGGGFVNTEKVNYCVDKMFLKNQRESKMSQ